MTAIKLTLFVVFLLETLVFSAAPAGGAEGIISKVATPVANYCHLKFPAIREETLYWDRPVLKDPSEGDIIDFYGPCDHDPLGKAEIQQQRDDWRRRLRREAMDGD